MAKSKKNSVNRRGFLKGAAVGAAAIVAGQNVDAQTAPAQPAGQARAATALPSAGLARVETAAPPPADVYTTDRPGSDFMVDVIKTLGFEYIAANPGSTFRGLH
jgi:acetolactate synthase-1/2/3 large subunit